MTLSSKAKQTRTNSFGFLVHSIGRRIDTRMKEQLATHDIDVKVLASLMTLAEEEGVNQRHLGNKMGFPEYFTSRNIDALVKCGFVVRKPDPDSRRTVLLYLTDAGRAKAASLPEIITANNAEFLLPLNNKEQKTLISLLQKIAGVSPD